MPSTLISSGSVHESKASIKVSKQRKLSIKHKIRKHYYASNQCTHLSLDGCNKCNRFPPKKLTHYLYSSKNCKLFLTFPLYSTFLNHMYLLVYKNCFIHSVIHINDSVPNIIKTWLIWRELVRDKYYCAYIWGNPLLPFKFFL